MDKLSLRRALYTDPAQVPVSDLQQHPDLQQLQQELFAQNQQLKRVLQLEVPVNLADKVLLQQKFSRKSPWRNALAMAASAALLGSYLLWQPALPPTDLGQHALRHIYHELAALKSTVTLDADKVATLLAKTGLSHSLTLPVRYASFCELEGIKSLHLVLDYQGAVVTVFVLPANTAEPALEYQQFADSRFIGRYMHWQQRQILVVTEQPELLLQFGELLNNTQTVNT